MVPHTALQRTPHGAAELRVPTRGVGASSPAHQSQALARRPTRTARGRHRACRVLAGAAG